MSERKQWSGRDAKSVSRPAVRLAVTITAGLLTAGASADILLDDLSDRRDEGWIHWDQLEGGPYGPGVFDASSGEYVIASRGPVPVNFDGSLASEWFGVGASPPPWSSHGTIRAAVRHASDTTTLWVGRRTTGNLEDGASGYRFEIPSAGTGLRITRIDGDSMTTLAETLFIVPLFEAGEQLTVEARATGRQLSLKVWRTDMPEPDYPQVVARDHQHESGSFLIGVSHFGPAGPMSGVFDDIRYTIETPGDASADGAIDLEDVLAVLTAWDCQLCPEDLNQDRRVDLADLMIVLANWR